MLARISFPSMVLLLALCAHASAETPLTTVRVAQGLSRPLFVTAPPGDTARVFIVEQRGTDARGRIKILKNGVVLSRPFLTTDVLSTGGEQGLLGLAFAPDYATTGRFYINYTQQDGTTIVARHTVSSDPDSANPAGMTILEVPQPFNNHNGGWLAFGPDGYLYLALGDGGSGGDPGDRAQDLGTPLGKILRIDVNGPGTYTIPPGNPFAGPIEGLDEIWSFGLRNPWRPSFDRQTGDFVIADVGQNEIEEINFSPGVSSMSANYGWRCFEGDSFYTESATTPCDSCLAPACPKVFPVYQYSHALGRCSVTGGYVYRGCAIPDLSGEYFFADYCAATIYSGRFSGGTLVGFRDRTAQLAPQGGFTIGQITSFGEDARGELYICDQGGEVFKIVPAASVLEQDMPALHRGTATGDSLGSTTPGNALLPGIAPFADAGSRIRGVGYLKDAAMRDCPALTGGCLDARMRLGVFDIDLEACVDSAASTLTRRFVFTNRSGGPQPLAYIDVVTPKLDGNEDGATTTAPAGAGSSAVLVLADTFQPDLYITHRGSGSSGVSFSADIDTASQLVARVAADQPLGGGISAGPAFLGLALGFHFGSVSPSAPETVTVVTSLSDSAPSGVDPGDLTPAPRPGLGLGPVPFRSELGIRLVLPHEGSVELDVFDVQGRRVRSLHRGVLPSGFRLVAWDGRLESGQDAPSGIYFVRFRWEGASLIRRAVRLR